MPGLTLAAMLGLAQHCAPGVAPETLLSVAHAESRFDPLAIGVNQGGTARPVKTAAEAVAEARRLIGLGRNVDLGVAQINMRNLDWLGLDLTRVFDPCLNLAAAGRLLAENYRRMASDRSADQALLAALSMYNSGDPLRGQRNGYVARVMTAARTVVPAIRAAHPATDPATAALQDADAAPAGVALASAAPAPAPPPAWDVFAARRASPVVIFGEQHP